MRLAFVSTILGYPWGGADKLWTAAAELALREQHAVFAAVSPQVAEYPRVRQLAERGARVFLRSGFTQMVGRRSSWRQRWERWRRHSRSLTAALDVFAPDFVFLNQGGAFDFLVDDGLMAWLTETRTPYVILCQSNGESDSLSPEAGVAARPIAAAARRFAFVSTHNLRLAERQLGVPLPNAVLLQHPVELAFPTPLAWPDEPIVRFAVVARIEAEPKGLDLLIAALAQALGSSPDWRLDFFGQGPDEAKLRAMADRAGLGDRIQFCGFNADLRTIWSSHHLLLLPSRREGCALAMLEAMVCGRPVLAAPVGGVDDWVQDGANGFVAAECAVAALASALRAAWARRSEWPELGRRAHAIQLRFDPTPAHTLLALARTA